MHLLILLIRTLTFRKVQCLLKTQTAYLLAKLIRYNQTLSSKPYLSIEASSICNLSCPECITGSGELTRVKGHISLQHFKAIIDQCYQHTVVLNLYMQGEPYLNPALPQMVAYAKEKNIFVSVSTNAQQIPELSKASLPHHLIVSADGATQDNYAAYRVGGLLTKVKAFTLALAQWKKENESRLPYVELQFLINRHNEGEIEATKQLFRGGYNRFVTKTMQIIHPENKDHFLPRNKKNSRYASAPKAQRGCYKMLSTHTITQDGELALCCMDKNAIHSSGNLNKESLSTITSNEKNHKLREQLINYKEGMDICQNCSFR